MIVLLCVHIKMTDTRTAHTANTARTALFAEFGRPHNSRELGLDSRNKYSRKCWTNYRSKSGARPFIITRVGVGLYRTYHQYDKGEIAYTTTDELGWFSSVMTRRPERKHVSLQNAVTIRCINDDFTTTVVYERS